MFTPPIIRTITKNSTITVRQHKVYYNARKHNLILNINTIPNPKESNSIATNDHIHTNKNILTSEHIHTNEHIYKSE